MSVDIVKLLKDHKINFATRGTQITEGWIGIETCPHCKILQ